MDGGQSSGSLYRRPTKSPDGTYKHRIPRPKEGIYMPKEPLPKQEAQAESHHSHKPKEAQAEAADHHQPRDNQHTLDAAQETEPQRIQFEGPNLAIQIYKHDYERELYQKEPLCLKKDILKPGHAFLSRKSFSKEVILPGNEHLSRIIDGAKRPLINFWDQGKYYFKLLKTAKGCYNNYSVGPGLFKYVGSETKGLLYHDYLSKSLRLEENTKYFLNFAAGSMVFEPNPLQKMMLNVNHVNTSMCLNGTVGDNYMAKFSFDGILGAQTKAVLYLPIPSFQSKIEFQSLNRFAALTGSFGTGKRPCLDVSCMLGTKLGAVGCQYKLDPATSALNCSAGLSVQTPCTSLGLIMDQDQIFTATLHKTYPQWRTSIGVKAKFGFKGPYHLRVPRLGIDAPYFRPVAPFHLRVPRHGLDAPYFRPVAPLQDEDDQVAKRAEDSAVVLGMSHSVNESLLLKSRFTSDGLAAVVVKKTFWGHMSLAGSAQVDLLGIREKKPSVGLLVSVF